MQMKSGVAFQPRVDAGMFVRPIVVDDEVQIQIERRLDVDELEKPNKFLMPVARHAVADDLAVEHAEGREKGGGSVALVIVSLAGWDTGPQGQQRLSSIQSLNLAFLVDTEHQCFVGRVQVKADDIVEFFDERFVAAELERFDPMRLPVVLLPKAMNRVFAEALRLGQAARTPRGCVGRGGVQGRMNDRAHLAMGDSWNAAGTRGVFFQSRKPQGQKALPPELHGGSRNPESAGNDLAQHAIGGHPDNLCALDHPERKASSRRPFVENDSFVGGQRYGFGHPHEYRA